MALANRLAPRPVSGNDLTLGPDGNPRNLDDYCDYVNFTYGRTVTASIITPEDNRPRYLHLVWK